MRFALHFAYFLGVVIAFASEQPGDQQLEPSLAPPPLTHESPGGFVGTNACVQCHKDGHEFQAHALAGKEYTIWVNRDPHSCAYTNLFNEKSKAIARNLKLDTPPHKNDLCLNCHATNVPKHELAFDSKHTVTDGVGCESCHGPAEKWLVQHKLPDWKYWSPSQKAAIGYVNTDNIASRARTCVPCHVGSSGRDVNHDLIAAGHPRLYFEMSAYQAKMPRHWSRTKDLLQNSVNVETRLWLVGQYVSCAASLELLKQRASDSDAPWPEFAEYSCFSCHHSLVDERWKKDPFANGAQSKPDWGTWHFSALEKLVSPSDSTAATDLAVNLASVREVMQNQMFERGSISSMTVDMKNYCNTMADFYSHAPLSSQDVGALANDLIASQTETREMNWDALTQRYLAAVAIRQSRLDARWKEGRFSDPQFEQSRNSLIKIRNSLKFIENYDGPKDLGEAKRMQINQNFREILDSLKN